MYYKNSKFKSRLILILYILVGFSAITYFVNKQKDLNSDIPKIEVNDNKNINNDKEFKVLKEEDNSSKEDIENNKVSLKVDVEVTEKLSRKEYENLSLEIEKTVRSKNNNKELNNLSINYLDKEGRKLHTYNFEGR